MFRGKYQLGALCNILHNDTSNVYLRREDLPVCLIKHCACSWGTESLAGTHPGCKHRADNHQNNCCAHFIVYVCAATLAQGMKVDCFGGYFYYVLWWNTRTSVRWFTISKSVIPQRANKQIWTVFFFGEIDWKKRRTNSKHMNMTGSSSFTSKHLKNERPTTCRKPLSSASVALFNHP